jgi:hypothetical protein
MHKTNVHDNVWSTCFWCCNEESNVMHVHGFVFLYVIRSQFCFFHPWLLLF